MWDAEHSARREGDESTDAALIEDDDSDDDDDDDCDHDGRGESSSTLLLTG